MLLTKGSDHFLLFIQNSLCIRFRKDVVVFLETPQKQWKGNQTPRPGRNLFQRKPLTSKLQRLPCLPLSDISFQSFKKGD